MTERLKYHDILYDDRQIGLYPTDKLKRVEKPLYKSVIPPEDREKRKETDHIFAQAAQGAYGPELAKLAPRMTVQEPMGAAFVDVQRFIGQMPQNEVASTIAPITQDPRTLARHIKSFATFCGADMVGICKMQPHFVYTHNEFGEELFNDYKYAIVLIVRKHVPTMTATDGSESMVDAISYQAYQRLALQTQTLANYIRRLGYPAAPSHMMHYHTLMMPMVVEAGLGEISRMGLAVNPFIGANFKAAAVLTDMPLEIDKPIDFGLRDFCYHCGVCRKVCPEGAIPGGDPVIYNGYESWQIDKDKCGRRCMEKRICGRCSRLCPWSNPDISPEAYKDWDGSIEWLHDRARARIKEMVARNFREPEEDINKWWFDLLQKDENSDELVAVETGLENGL